MNRIRLAKLERRVDAMKQTTTPGASGCRACAAPSIFKRIDYLTGILGGEIAPVEPCPECGQAPAWAAPIAPEVIARLDKFRDEFASAAG